MYLASTSGRVNAPVRPVINQVRSSVPRRSAHLRLWLLMTVLAYIGFLHLSYVYVISPVWSYRGLIYAPAGASTILLAAAIACIPVLWMPLRSSRPSLVVYYLLYLFVVLPTCIVPAYTAQLDSAARLALQTAILSCFAVLGAFYKMPLWRLPDTRLSPFWFAMLILGLSGVCYGVIFFFAGLHLSVPNLSEVYDVRADFKAYVGSNWVVDYAMDWQSNVLNPVLISYGLIAQRLWAFSLGILGQFVIYSTGGTKTVAFSILLLLFMFVVFRGARNVYLRLVGSMAMLVLAAAAVDLVTHSDFVTSLFVRRMIFVPAQLTTLYYDFFSTHPHALLAHSIFKGFISYPYAQDPPLLIGAYYFGGSNMNANANIWADGFANFGYFGMLGATLLTGCWLWLVDSSSSFRNQQLTILILCVPSVALTDSGLLTDLASHGLFLALLIISVLPNWQVETTSHPPHCYFNVGSPSDKSTVPRLQSNVLTSHES